MKIGPKYKIARRLGAPVFEKTQTQKFKLRTETKEGNKKKRGKPKSQYGLQLIEKQKARFIYGITEKQFAKYVKNIVESKLPAPTSLLFAALETRLDNVVSRLGLVNTRRFARQAVSHGHILVNGRKLNVPSYTVRPGDVISVREGSKNSAMFKELDKMIKEASVPNWLAWNAEKQTASVLRLPTTEGQDIMFDLGAIIEFYKR